MRIEYPAKAQIPALKQLWKDSFHDTDAFIEDFFSAGFLFDHCRCVISGGVLCAALYWFDCEQTGVRLAYLYAVATAADFRGRGICRSLLEDTRKLLQEKGYGGILLVPGDEGLARMYEKLGFAPCTGFDLLTCEAGEAPVTLREVSGEAYGRLRRAYLPTGGVVQEGRNLEFLERQAALYAGADFILAAQREENRLTGLELLGKRTAAPGILNALGCTEGSFRVPGTEHPFAMYLPLREGSAPTYFGLAFD